MEEGTSPRIHPRGAKRTKAGYPFIKLLEADGLNQLHDGANRGDAGDPYPGRSKNVALTHASNPNAKSYGGVNTCVTVTNISATGRKGSTAVVDVRRGKSPDRVFAHPEHLTLTSE